MATSLAAAIGSAFDTEVTLVEGHNGIYEVSIGYEVLYTNEGQCSQGFPSHEQIIEQIGQFIGEAPKQSPQSESRTDQDQAPSCTLPNESTQDSITNPLPMVNPSDSNSDCGCTPSSSTSSIGAGCCESVDSNPGGQRTSFIKGLLTGAIVMLALVLAGLSIARKTGWYEGVPDLADSRGVTLSDGDKGACSTTPVQDSILARLIGQNEAVFALLPCDHENHTQELRESVSPAIRKLQASGKRTDLVVIDPSSPTYTRLIDLHGAESFPCLTVIGTSCASTLLSDDFTEERLFAAFVKATSPVSSSSCSTPCGAQSSDSNSTVAPCCPK